jgi:N-acetylneuraminate synthase
MAALCLGAKTAWKALGIVDYGRKSSEMENVKFRRSLYFVRDMKAGELITPDCVRSVRPGFGLPPKQLEQVIGKNVAMDISVGTPVSFEKLK